MRVAIFNGVDRPITIESLAMPELAADQVRIAVERCGVCGSDVTLTSGSAFDFPVGCAMGHEFSGEVVEVGGDVSHFRSGDRVICIPKAGCGHCSACRDGHHFWCPTGPTVFGGFGDFVSAPQGNVFMLPQSLSFADGALVEPMACGLHALTKAGLERSQSILVLGAGSVALSVIFWARHLGARRIVVASRSGARRDMAMALGADAFHSFEEDDPAALDSLLTEPPDIVAECVGKPDFVQNAVERVRLGGTVLSMGMCTVPDRVVPALATFKEVRLLFPLAYSVDEFAETIRVFDAGKVRPEQMVSKVIALAEVPAMIEAMRLGQSHLKVHVNPKMDKPNN